MESFKRKRWDELLTEEIYDTLREVELLVEHWWNQITENSR